MMDYDHDNGDYYQYGGYTDDDSDKIDSETEEALQSYLNYNSFSATNKVAGKTEKSKEEKRIIAIDDDSDSKYNIKKKNNIVIDLTSNLEPGEIINSSDIDVDERNETISISSDDESNESDDGEQRSVVLEAKEIKTSDIQADKDFLTSQAKEKGRYFNSVPMAKKCFKCDGDHLQANCPVKDSCTLCGKRGHIDRYCSLLLMCFNCKEKGHRKEDCKNEFVRPGCEQCGSIIHSSLECTEFWRKYKIKRNIRTINLPTKLCSLCAGSDHVHDECEGKKISKESAFKDIADILFQQRINGINIRRSSGSDPNHFYFKTPIKGNKGFFKNRSRSSGGRSRQYGASHRERQRNVEEWGASRGQNGGHRSQYRSAYNSYNNHGSDYRSQNQNNNYYRSSRPHGGYNGNS